MALSKKQIALIDACPVLKSMKDELIEALGGGSGNTTPDEGGNTTPDEGGNITP